jgi:MoaA/NifB/PqqE/SkfB family radical SAM enzyme
MGQYEILYDAKGNLKHGLGQIMVNLTHRCFFRCRTCESWKNKEEELSLPLSAYARFFHGASKIAGGRGLVSFTGGEPLLYDSVYSLIRQAKNESLTATINTNGWLLDEKRIGMLIDAGIDSIVFSLDGSSPEIHDRIRGMPGSFDRIMKAAAEIRRQSASAGKVIGVSVCTVISALNLHDAVNIAEKINKSDLFDVAWFQAVAPILYRGDISLGKSSATRQEWHELAEYADLWPRDRKLVEQTYKTLINLKAKGYKMNNEISRLEMQRDYFLGNQAARKEYVCTMFKDIILDRNGDVFHCSVKNEKIGNIMSEDIEDMWRNARGRLLKEDIVDCRDICHTLINCGLPKDIRLREAWKDGTC